MFPPRDTSRSSGWHRATGHLSLGVFCLLSGLLWASGVRAQSPDEHASHHPGGAASAPAPATSATGGMGGMPAAPATSAAGGMAGGMGAMMAGMMPPPPSGGGGCMGGDCGGSGAAKTPIYPSLMTLPALTPAKRAEIDALATQQINEGMARLAKGSESLNRAMQAGDNVAMQKSVGLMHEGLDELGAGIAARRVLSEGAAPRNLALGWFKREMNLSSSVPHEEPRTFLGVAPLHLFTMVLLVAFALAMVAMYFFKMRRAAALFGRIEADKAKSPPGSSPPLSGEPGTPPTGKTPACEGTPPAQPPGKEPPPAAPPAAKTATPPSSPPPPPSKEASAPAKAPAPSAPGTPPAGNTSPAAGTSPTTPPAPLDTAKIESRAGELWQERGRPVGSPEVDWSRAKEELAKATDESQVPPIAGTLTASTPPGKESPPAAPPAAKPPSPGATPPASAAPTPPSPPTPSAERSPASAPLPAGESVAAVSATTPGGHR